MGPQQRILHERAVERPRQMAGLATREVDEVGLADRLGMRGVVGVGAVPDADRLHFGAEAAEVLGAHGGPALEHGLAVGP
jgi:hypothetical protein